MMGAVADVNDEEGMSTAPEEPLWLVVLYIVVSVAVGVFFVVEALLHG